MVSVRVQEPAGQIATVGDAAKRILRCGVVVMPLLSSFSISPAAAASSNAIDVRLLAQEGLAIALASTVLQTQLIVLGMALDFQKGCVDLGNGGGSYKPTTKSKPMPQNSALGVNFYFDQSCRSIFAEAKMNVKLKGDQKNGRYILTGDVVYHDKTGKAVGKLGINEAAVFKNEALVAVNGLGDFTPQGKGLKARLGLACALPSDLSEPFTCSGGVAQDFTSLKASLGSVSPLTLKLGDDDDSVAFSGKSSELATAKLSDLKIVRKGDDALDLSDPHETVGSTQARGSAASFSLFPPTPTSWTVSNAKKGLTFSLKVLDDATRKSTATITSKSGAQLAVIKVDQSGTGTIKYLNGDVLPVISWVLGG